MIMKSRKYLHLLYVLADLVIVFFFTLTPFIVTSGVVEVFSSFSLPIILSLSMALFTVLLFFVTRIYSIVTSEIGIFEALKIVAILAVVQVLSLVLSFSLLFGWMDDPIGFSWVWVATSIGVCLFVPAVRFARRLLGLLRYDERGAVRKKTIIIGAGASGKIAVDEIRRNRKFTNKVVAFVDDDPNKIGGSLANVPIKGPISDIAKIIDYCRADEVIIAMSNISRSRFNEIVTLLESCPVKIMRMPLLSEMDGPHERKILDIDVNDLLCRDSIQLDNSQIESMFKGNTILITGAGGTIGSELVRQISKANPKRIVLFDIYENATYQIQMELMRLKREQKLGDLDVVTLIGSTYNEFRVEQIIKKYRPDYIFHAAAYKHVPLMEDSPAEAIRTNVIGTYNVAKMADKYGVKKMILVSTDKAVRPTSVMGATKRFAELIIQHFASISKNTNYAAVRFGNVLGSNGSVVPLFKKQIEAGGPVTLTHSDIIRYFMTIPEAVSLILQCGLFAKDGEIFILDMGKPVKIKNLAERMIRQAGLVPYVDIDIVETGLRPGEKLYEELLLDKEHQQKTGNSRIFIEEKAKTTDNLADELKKISQVFTIDDNSEVKKLLSNVIATYTITENK